MQLEQLVLREDLELRLLRDAEIDEQIAAYKRDVDYGLLRENLTFTVEQRLIRLMQLQKFFEGMQAAGRAKDLVVIAELEALAGSTE